MLIPLINEENLINQSDIKSVVSVLIFAVERVMIFNQVKLVIN